MIGNILNDDIRRLNFEDYVWIVFVFLCFLNIYGNQLEKIFLRTNNPYFQRKSNSYYIIALVIVFLIYSYFITRNLYQFHKASPQDKALYSIKVLGSILLTLQRLKHVEFLYTFTSKYTRNHIRLINFYKTFTTKDTIVSINDSIRLMSKPIYIFSF